MASRVLLYLLAVFFCCLCDKSTTECEKTTNESRTVDLLCINLVLRLKDSNIGIKLIQQNTEQKKIYIYISSDIKAFLYQFILLTYVFAYFFHLTFLNYS